jgi:hypothetical protein
MTQAIVNLALPVVTAKIEEILAFYPAYPHQEIFASTALRQKLTAYVLTRMPTLYTTVEDVYSCSMDKPEHCYSPEQQQHMIQLIREGIQHLLIQHQTWSEAAQSTNVPLSPSSWFG